jgi:hypothetical protein
MNQLNAFSVEVQQALMNRLDNMTVLMLNRIDPGNPPGLEQGTTTNTSVRVANTTKYLCAGVPKSKSAAEVAFPTSGNSSYTGPYDVAPNASSVQERVYAITINAAGTLGMIAGAQATGSGNAPMPEYPQTNVSYTDADGNTYQNNAQYTNGIVILGTLRIAVAAGSTGFEANTTEPETSGAVTATYQDGFTAPFFNSVYNTLGTTGSLYQ